MPAELNRHLPRRDYLIIPLLSLFSAVALLTIIEFTARSFWQAREDSSCDLKTPVGDRYKPNCVDTSKIAEGPWVQSHFNECGYRSEAPCGPKPSHTIRLVLLGSSEAMGQLVPYEQTFAALSEKILVRQCGRPVEVQNLGVAGIHLLQEAHRADEALALHPDAVILLVSPATLGLDADPHWRPEGDPQPAPMITQKYGWRADLMRLKSFLRHSTAFSMLLYYYFQDDDAYLHTQFKTFSDRSAVLRLPFSQAWQTRFDFLDSVLTYLSSKVQSKGIPLVIISSLIRPQAALLDLRTNYPGLDAFAFDREVEQIAGRHGIVSISVIDDFSRLPHATSLFYVADMHMNAAGQNLLAESFTRQILQSKMLERLGCSAVPEPELTARRP